MVQVFAARGGGLAWMVHVPDILLCWIYAGNMFKKVMEGSGKKRKWAV